MAHSFNHVGLTVADIATSARFYAQFGFTPEEPEAVVCDEQWIKTMSKYPDADLRIAWLELDGVTLELLQYESPVGGKTTPLGTNDAGSAHVAIGLDDVEAEYARLSAAGINFRSEPITVPDGPFAGIQAVYAIDPDGNTVELIQMPAES
jgi:catechol 2,3-dioxygenase-like lactoylglutathione lyase family enzyme